MSLLDEILFPRRCPVCLDIVVPSGELICEACRDKMPMIRSPRCMKCGKQLSEITQEFCGNCGSGKRSFVQGIAGWDYTSVPVRRMIAEVKYHNKRQLLDYPCVRMAETYAECIEQWGIQCLVPIPLHRSKQRKRGFNQAEEAAVRLGRIWNIPVEKQLLYRIKKTQPQKELGEAARMRNLIEAFSVDKAKASHYKCAALVDDIYTTGSTMEAGTRMLMRAGIEQVYVISLTAGRG